VNLFHLTRALSGQDQVSGDDGKGSVNWGLSEVTVRFGGRVALDGVSLSAAPGQVTAVVGGDGAGKTTLLRVLVGLIRPRSGTVARPPRNQLGYFSAASGVYPDLTVAQNLSFSAAAYHTRDRERADELLEVAGLAGVTDRLAGHLSGGMRQKLGLAMAMLHRPVLLVLDEPTTGVDPVSRAELSRLIVRAAAAGTAVVLATAYLDEAERAGAVVVLDAGRVLRSGAPGDIIAGLPGTVVATPTRPAGPRSWRRGAAWHAWLPPGTPAPADATSARVDLQDAVLVAALEDGQ
jgi:ABC-2 type transport system ATP-binding protein